MRPFETTGPITLRRRLCLERLAPLRKDRVGLLACRVLRRRKNAREAVNDVLAARRLKAGLHYRKASAALELIERPDATSTPSGSALG
jgi:hypothetical protein